MDEYLKAAIWEHSDHLETMFPSKELYYYRRGLSIGSVPTIELYNILRGIELSNEVRESPIFKFFFQQVNQHIFLVNDVFSLKKEIRLSEVDNFILKQQKHSLQKSFDRVVSLENEALLRVKDTSRALLKLFPSDDSLGNFIDNVQWLLDGQFYWYERCERSNTRLRELEREALQPVIRSAL